MQKREFSLFQDLYVESLKTINDIRFTPKEIDVMTCILSGRGRKAIGSLLTISDKTVETHIRNISQKLACNSQEAIREYLEKSNKFIAIRAHYLSLLANATFEQHLYKIAALTKEKGLACSLVSWEDESSKFFIKQLEKDLILSGIQVFFKNYKINSPFSLPYKGNNAVYIFLIPPKLLKDCGKEHKEIFKYINEVCQKKSHLLILLLENNENLSKFYMEGKKFQCIFFNKEKNYYYLYFNLLQKMFSGLPLKEVILRFKKQYECVYEASEKSFSQPTKNPSRIPKLIASLHIGVILSLLKERKKWPLMISGLCFMVFSVYLLFFNVKINQKSSPLETSTTQLNLTIPEENAYLNRPELIAQIDNAFKNQHPIRTVALVGIGGIGKTTLARQYAQQQNSSIVWEINGETKETLCEAFEKLSVILSKTTEDQKILQGLKEIKNAVEREEKLLQFVQKHLLSLPNWFLIYDNIEKLADVESYFPTNMMKWGTGKVIITTRNTAIHDNSVVDHVILMPDLNLEQKLILFLKIVGKEKEFQSDFPLQTKEFLQELPPFPLDVSIAAYYLKMTNVTYEQYISRLKKNNKYFDLIQGNILKEMGNYTKTRYGIISMSLQRIIEVDKDFEGLLLFISLLDSQDIPKDLLDFYKNEVVVDNFIYHLKKYSLIINDDFFSSLGSIFSIHRSTQEISTSYLIKALNLEKNTQIIQDISNIIENYITRLIKKEDTSKMKLLISHCEGFLRSSNLLKESINGSIESKLGGIYLYLGDYKRAEILLEKSLWSFDRYDSKNYFKISWTLEHLGEVYNDIGNYMKAREVLEKSLSIYNKYLSDNRGGVARILERLGNVYDNMGNYEKARDLLEQSLSIYRKYFPDDHNGLARTLGRLGNVYRDLGEFEKARERDEQSLAIYREYFPENQVRIARQLSGLGNIYKYLGNYEKAKELLEESLVIYQKELPLNHIYTTWAFIFLGNIYKKLGDYEKARGLLEKNLIICENHYGKNHIKVAEILRELGEIYLLKNDMESSEKLFLKSLAIFQKDHHSDCYATLESLADLYKKKLVNTEFKKNSEQHQYIQKKEINYLRQALKIAEDNFPQNSPHILRLRSKLTGFEDKTKHDSN